MAAESNWARQGKNGPICPVTECRGEVVHDLNISPGGRGWEKDRGKKEVCFTEIWSEDGGAKKLAKGDKMGEK